MHLTVDMHPTSQAFGISQDVSLSIAVGPMAMFQTAMHSETDAWRPLFMLQAMQVMEYLRIRPFS